MEALLVLLVLGYFLGWGLGVAGWFQARKARQEVAALRAALAQAGIAVPVMPVSPAWPPPEPEVEPSPEAEPARAPAAEEAAAPQPAPPAPARPGLEEALTLRWGMWL